jgi:hypothetical protein
MCSTVRGPWLKKYVKISRRVRNLMAELETWHQHLDGFNNTIKQLKKFHRGWRRALNSSIKVIKGHRAEVLLQQANHQHPLQQLRNHQEELAVGLAGTDQGIRLTRSMLRGVRAILDDLAKLKRRIMRSLRHQHRRHRHRRHHHRRHHH